ncbi:hypothetical protein [Hyphococcus sp.]|uniref:hypothetical protein n=1 Tax=Hyphococcus sp. TaxID=2038636 RepID=UPI0035C68604
MQRAGKIIGYVIADPRGHYPDAPEFAIGRLEEALAEARDLNRGFADEIGGGGYCVMALFATGAAGSLS